MESVVKVEAEEVPEVTEDDVYLDIDGVVEEAEQYHMETTDTKPPLPVIKRERISPLPWHGNLSTNFSSQHLNSRSVACDIGQGVKRSPFGFIKKLSVLPDPNGDEEIDVESPYCGKLRGQTQDRTELNMAYSSLSSITIGSQLLKYVELSRMLASRSTVKKNLAHSSLTATKISISNSCHSSQKQSKKSKTARKSTSKAVSNVAKKSTSKQSKPARKPVSDTLSTVEKPTDKQPEHGVGGPDSTKPTVKQPEHGVGGPDSTKPTVKQPEHGVGGPGSSGVVNTTKRPTSTQAAPAVTQSVRSAFSNVAKKSTSKQAKSHLNTSSLHSQISKSSSKIDGPRLCSTIKPLSPATQNVVHCGVEGNELDRIQSSEIPLPCPDTVTAIEKPQSDFTYTAINSPTTPDHNLSQELSAQATKTMFAFTEKSSKKIGCPVCHVQTAQFSLKDHLKTVHSMQLKSCAKCKIGFTDLNQYSEHYAFHLQQEEDQIAGILGSSLKTNEQTNFAQQRLTRKQREKFVTKTKRKHSEIDSGQHVASDKDVDEIQSDSVLHTDPVFSQPRLQRPVSENNLSPVKRPRSHSIQIRRPCSFTSSLTEDSSVSSQVPQSNILPKTEKTRTTLPNSGTKLVIRSPLDPAQGESAGGGRGNFPSHQSETSGSDLTEAAALLRMKQATDFQRRRRSRSLSVSSGPAAQSPSKRQRLEEPIFSDSTCSQVTVSLVSLEAASQPFNCDLCLKAFHTALVCPQSFRQNIQQAPSACGLSRFVTSDENNFPENKTKEKRSTVQAVSVSPMDKSVIQLQETIQYGEQTSTEKENVVKSQGYKCRVCDKKFLYHSKLIRHTLYHSDQFVCGFCQKAYKEKADLFDHFELMHQGKMRFRCKYCKRMFEDVVHFETHIKVHKDGTAVRCTVCNKTYTSSKQMLLHLKSSHGPCDLCGMKFHTENQFVMHTRTAHAKLPKPTISKPLCCGMCARVFQTVQGLLSHRRRHHAVKSASLSARSVGVKRTLSQLQRNVSTPDLSAAKSEQVSESGNVSRTKKAPSQQQQNVFAPKLSPVSTKEVKVSVSQQDKSITSHADCRSYSTGYKSDSLKCRLCHKILYSMKGLKSHYNLCHKEIPLLEHSTVKTDGLPKCPKCNKHFYSHANVFRHIRLVHNKTLRSSNGSDKQKSDSQKCRKPGKDFGSKGGKTFLAHTKDCHAKHSCWDQATGKDNKLKYKCALCEKSFAWERNVIRHMITIHDLTREEIFNNMTQMKSVKTFKSNSTKSQLYLCKFCKECFTQRKSYRLHQINRHGGKSDHFQCRFCRKVLSRSNRLLLHIKTQHQGKLPFLCRGCNQEFTTSEAVFMHKCCPCDTAKEYRQKKEHSCQEVTKTCQTGSPWYRYRCAACNIGFYIAREWTKHMQIHFDNGSKDAARDGELDAGTSQNEEMIGNLDIGPGSVSSCQMHDEGICKLGSCDTLAEQTATPHSLSLGSVDISREETKIYSADDEPVKPTDISCEVGLLTDNSKLKTDSWDEGHTYPESAKKSSVEEKRDGAVRNSQTGSPQKNPDIQKNEADAKKCYNLTADMERKSSNANKNSTESKTVHGELGMDMQGELSLHAFEDLYETAWNSEFLVDANTSSMLTEGNPLEKEISLERKNTVCKFGVDLVADRNKDVTDLLDGGMQSRSQTLSQLVQDVCTKTDARNTTVSNENQMHQHAEIEENTARVQQVLLANHECTELINESQQEVAGSLKEKIILERETRDSVHLSIGESEHVAQDAQDLRPDGSDTCENVAVSIEHKERKSTVRRPDSSTLENISVSMEQREMEPADRRPESGEFENVPVPIEHGEKDFADRPDSSVVENTAVPTEQREEGSTYRTPDTSMHDNMALLVEQRQECTDRRPDSNVADNKAEPTEQREEGSTYRTPDRSMHDNMALLVEQRQECTDRRPDSNVADNKAEPIKHREKEPAERRPDQRVNVNTVLSVERRDKEPADRRPDQRVNVNTVLSVERRDKEPADRRPDQRVNVNTVLSVEHREKEPVDRRPDQRVNVNTVLSVERRDKESATSQPDRSVHKWRAASVEHREKSADRRPDEIINKNITTGVELGEESADRRPDESMSTGVELREESVDRRPDSSEHENTPAPAEHKEKESADRLPDGSVHENLAVAVELRDKESADSSRLPYAKSMAKRFCDLLSLKNIFACQICKKIFTDENCLKLHKCDTPAEQNTSHASLSTEHHLPELTHSPQPPDRCSKYESRDECTGQTQCEGKAFNEKENSATCFNYCTSTNLEKYSQFGDQELTGTAVSPECSFEIQQSRTEERHKEVDKADDGHTDLNNEKKIAIKTKTSSAPTADREDPKDAPGYQNGISVSEEPKIQNKNILENLSKGLPGITGYCLNSISNSASTGLIYTSGNQTSAHMHLSENCDRHVSDGPVENQKNQQNEQPQSLEKEAQDAEICDSDLEGQNKRLEGIMAEQQQNKSNLGLGEVIGGAHKNVVNNCMLKCVSVLRQKLTFKKDAKVVRKEDDMRHNSENTDLCVVQNTQGIPFHEDRTAAVKHRDKSGTDDSRMMGTKYEARRSNIFDVLSSENLVICPVCKKPCRDEEELSQHYCTMLKGQSSAHAPVPTKKMATELAFNREDSGKTTELEEKTGCSQISTSDLCDQTVSMAKEQNTCHTSPDSPENNSTNEISISCGKTDDQNSQIPVSSYTEQSADVSKDLKERLVEDEVKHVSETVNLPPQRKVNCEETEDQVGICCNTDKVSPTGILREEQDNAHSRHTNLEEMVCETHSNKHVPGVIKDLKEKLVEGSIMESAGKDDDLATAAFLPEDRDMHAQGRPCQSRLDSQSAADRCWQNCSSDTTVETKYQRRHNIFDMLSSNGVNCPVSEKACKHKHQHYRCGGVSAEQSTSHSSPGTEYFAAEHTGTYDETCFVEATFNSDKSENGVKQLDTADLPNGTEWEEKTSEHSQGQSTDLCGYLPVGLYIRNSCTDQRRNQEHTENLCIAVNRVGYSSDSDVPDEPPVCSHEKQNESAISVTTFLPDAQTENLEHHVCELVEETSGDKITGNNESGSDPDRQFVPIKTSNKGLVTEQLQSLARRTTSKIQPNQNVLKVNQNETWDNLGKKNQCEESYRMVVEEQAFTDHRPPELEVQKSLTSKSVLTHVRGLRQETALDQGEEYCRKERDFMHIDTAAEENGQQLGRPSDSLYMHENQAAVSEHRSRSSTDSDKEMKIKRGKCDARSNIFDILSVQNVTTCQVREKECVNKNGVTFHHVYNMPPKQNTSHSALSSKDCTAAEPTGFSKQTVVSDVGPCVSRDTEDRWNRIAETEENTYVQTQTAYFCDNQTESEIRKQLSELLLNSQQNPTAMHMADSVTKLCDSGIDRQGELSVGLSQCRRNCQSDPAGCTDNLMELPSESVTDCMTVGSGLKLPQPKLDSFKENVAQDTDNCNIGILKQTSVCQTEAQQTEKLCRPVEQMREGQEKLTSGGMKRYIQSLKKKFTLDEDLLRKKIGSRLDHTVEESKEHFKLSSPDKKQPEDLHENEMASVKKEKRSSSHRDRQTKAAHVKTDCRLNIFDILSK